MVEALLKFCESKNIAIKDVKTLVAVSGGIDSVVLANLFYKLNANFAIAHCNFGLRGEESDQDEVFVAQLAKEMEVPFYSMRFGTKRYAEENGISIQMAARDLRYEWFEDLREETGCDQIATAHNKGDLVETVLFNLTKGTGIEGLHGIKAQTSKLIRPLLFATRDEIEAFAKQNQIEWREDSSNASVKYSRNKIRHTVLPALEEINPKAKEAIYSSAERINEAEQFLKSQVAEMLYRITEKKGENLFIDLEALHNLPGKIFVLHELLRPYGFSYKQTAAIEDSLSGLSGSLFYSETHVVNVDRNQLVVTPAKVSQKSLSISEKPDTYVAGSFTLETKIFDRNNYVIESSNTVLALDMDLLEFPLELRVWQKGDVFKPLGMKGKKKLSDFMIDAKIPVNLKNNVWVIVSGGNIAGVVNYRLDNRYKITDKTKSVFEISASEN